MKKLLLFLLVLCTVNLSAQNYATVADGDWNTPSTWNNTSGYGGPYPTNGWGQIDVNNNVSHAGSYSVNATPLNVAAGHTLTINGDFTANGGTINVYGNLVVTGNFTNLAVFNVMPGGSVTINGTTTSSAEMNIYGNYSGIGSISLSSNPLHVYPGGTFTAESSLTSTVPITVGTSVNPPPYADLVVKGNLNMESNGIVFNQNARAAIFGNVTSNSGGMNFTVNNGAQVYVHQDINFTGAGATVSNSNTTSPYGLYVNGNVNNNNFGTTTANLADKDYMDNNNVPFANWLNSIPSSPLPISLAKFAAKSVNTNTVIVSWTTASEINNQAFTLYRSTDARTWTAIAQINGAGNSNTTRNYQYTDARAQASNYYKLQQTDYDGTSTFSPVVAVSFAQTHLNLSPNPAHNTLQISAVEAYVLPEISVFDLKGKAVFQQSAIFTNQTAIDIQSWPSGIYIVKFSDASIPLQRFIKE
ncbi:Por secretion system C-terminal sorting domain-containing protein [Flexibacter flexilis DSM 6793]|uniref:Por secretion system C-terminal sorting domain-containing protein n=1 Tax=Flexibacter flexilis DSM 6793 TaxID=927664 RepID=A0A1I1GCG8_9BACT|nr:T9SS type A sorting domain-containing protein [Flexibacter flexilis]SFC06820.1 Por secretion system C-terminal sorting domain-containing protein [Flexibacter flexilis DSM 6793]